MEKFKIKANLIIMNIYARNQHLLDTRLKSEKTKTYVELVEKHDYDGIRQQFVTVPYPITPDYVKSFAGGADYRNNIAESWNAPARGVNLGDLTNVQEILSQDAEKARILMSSLIAKANELKEKSKVVEEKSKVVEEKIDVQNGGKE